ncbi:MAG: hypothetical protein D3908_16515, partial [Candidatus Electrothrix sp. AUS4]|nr:hypothetical protein [Candidatus Electrothrix sp. AUS4]
MKIRKKASGLNLLIAFLLAVAAFCQAATVLAAYPNNRPGQRIYDLASLLSPEQELQLETLTAQVATSTTAELNVVTVNSLYGESVEKYANNLFNEWAIGRADINNGVLFLIAPHERKVRIEVGYGLESLLTDVICSSIILEYIIPSFKAEQFGQGIIIGAERIAGVLRQHPDQAGEVKDSAPYHPSLFICIKKTGGKLLSFCAYLLNTLNPLLKKEQALLQVFLTTAGRVSLGSSLFSKSSNPSSSVFF